MPQLQLVLTDSFAALRTFTINALAASKTPGGPEVIRKIEMLVENEKNKKARAAALNFLVATRDAKYEPLYQKFVNDSSYSVSAAALEGLSALSPSTSYQLAKKYSTDAKGALGSVVFYIIMVNGTEADFDYVAKQYAAAPATQEKLEMTAAYADYLEKLNDLTKIKRAIDDIISFRALIPTQYRNVTDPVFKQSLDKVAKAKGAEIEKYINEAFK